MSAGYVRAEEVWFSTVNEPRFARQLARVLRRGGLFAHARMVKKSKNGVKRKRTEVETKQVHDVLVAEAAYESVEGAITYAIFSGYEFQKNAKGEPLSKIGARAKRRALARLAAALARRDEPGWMAIDSLIRMEAPYSKVHAEAWGFVNG